MKKSVYRWLLCFLTINCIVLFAKEQTGKAAQEIDKHATQAITTEHTSIPTYIEFQEDAPVQRQEYFQRYSADMPHDKVQEYRSQKDDIGMTHTRYKQYHRGLEVVGAEYILHEQNGAIHSANGLLLSGLNINVKPAISEEDALEIALEKINGKNYDWETDSEQSSKPKGSLVISSKDHLLSPKSWKLVYQFDIFAHQPLGRYNVEIDAQSGEIVNFYNRIHTAEVSMSGRGRYNGNVNFVGYLSQGYYYLYSNTPGVKTYDLENRTSKSSRKYIYGSSSYISHHSVGVQAHWGAEQTREYYSKRHGRNSYDNRGSDLLSYVNYSYDYRNAFWDGSSMTYGHHSTPLVTLDVCGHEITHGVTEYSAGLVYRNESGALNESFSDIFGEMVELYAQGRNDWLMAAATGSPFRSMSNPHDYRDPKVYHGQYWYTGSRDNGGVHTNSGVQNYVAYRIAQSIGSAKMDSIAYRTLVRYLGAYSNYADAAHYFRISARDLYRSNSAEYRAVDRAWNGAGLTRARVAQFAGVGPLGAAVKGTAVKVDAIGEDIAVTQPHVFYLKPNFPNPFNPATTIKFSLAKETQIKLAIYNIAGQKVATLVNKVLPAGERKITWDASQYPSGVYFAKFESDVFNKTIKMMLMK